jgi:predicted transcriptional regulator
MSDVVIESAALTIELPREIVDRLHALEGQATGSISDLLRETIVERVEYLEWKFAKIQEALDQIDAGAPSYSDDEVAAWIERLGTPDERPRPG